MRRPIIDEFVTRFTAQGGEICFAKTLEEIVDKINSLIEQKAKGPSCSIDDLGIRCTNVPRERFVDISSQLKTSISYADLARNPRETLRRLDIGITRSDWGIAETGSLVEVAYTDEQRLLSSISRIHISVIDALDILPKLQNLGPKLKDILSTEKSRVMKPVITLIGGPSRTSDIELKSVIGVHGPHEVHVIMYPEAT